MPFQHELNNLKQIKISIDHYIEQLKPRLTNKDFSLEDRWELFKELSPYLPIDPYGSDDDAERLGLISSEYDFGTERHQQVIYTDRYETFLDMKYAYDQYEEEPPVSFQDHNKLDEWRESVLALGIQGFHHD